MPMRLIQAGLGPWGRSWAGSVLPGSPDVEVVAWADPDPTARRATQELLGAPADRFHPGLEEALAAHPADAVLITSGIATHPPVALAALRAGKHVLVEKPFAPTVAEAAQVVAAAAERGLVLAVGQNYRFLPSMRTVIALVRAGTLGPVDRIRIDFRRNQPGRGPVRVEHELLTQLSIHHFDLLRAVLGREPQRVTCRAWSPPWSPSPAPVAAAAIIEFEGGPVVSYTGSRLSPGPETPWEGEWRVDCEAGEISWPGAGDGGEAADGVLVRPHGGPAYRVTMPVTAEGERAGVLRNFVGAVRDGGPPACPGYDNIGSIALLEAARESAASGHAVPIEMPGT